jgi:hypothetical protein
MKIMNDGNKPKSTIDQFGSSRLFDACVNMRRRAQEVKTQCQPLTMVGGQSIVFLCSIYCDDDVVRTFSGSARHRHRRHQRYVPNKTSYRLIVLVD